MTRLGNTLPKTGNFFPKNGNGRRTFAEQSGPAHRTHLTWSGKARDLPRFTEVYAHTAGALGLRLKRELSDVAISSRISEAAGLSQSRPAADRVPR